MNPQKKKNNLEGISFCSAGNLDTMTRKEAINFVKTRDGQVKSSVVKEFTYLVSNDVTPTTKYKEVLKQGTKMISENDFHI